VRAQKHDREAKNFTCEIFREAPLKARLYVIVSAAVALSACSGGGGSTPSRPNNPSLVTVGTTVLGTPTGGIAVTMTTALTGENDNVPSGTIIGTVTSDGSGEAIFNSGIPAKGPLCLSSTYVVGSQSQTLASCHSQPYPSSATINFTI
jgi:hypothetical protein